MRTSSSSQPALPPCYSNVAKLDPDFAYFIAREFDALHEFAVRLCERFGFTRADADALCEMATSRGMMARKLDAPMRDEVVRAWRSSLLNFVAAELNGMEPVFPED